MVWLLELHLYHLPDCDHVLLIVVSCMAIKWIDNVEGLYYTDDIEPESTRMQL